MLCVIRPDGKEDLKLIDFGMARVLEPGKTVKVACGTPEFVGGLASCKIKDPSTLRWRNLKTQLCFYG